MNRNFLWSCAVVIFILLAFALPALAGGWATITVDEWPAQIAANQPVVIGFTVRQHGNDKARMTGLYPTLTAKNPATGESFVVNATADGAAGHYVASVTFPQPGAWSWSIQAFSMDQPMPSLIVSAPQVKPAASSEPAFTPAIPAGLLGLAVVCVALGLAWRKRTRWALALVFVGLLAGGVGVASAAGKPASLASPLSRPAAAGTPAASPPFTQEEYGKVLFIAKGCATCHANPRVEAAFTPLVVDMGKNLTGYVAAPEFLRLWLKDPSAVKPNTQMPNLELSQAEIEALIAFINPSAETK